MLFNLSIENVALIEKADINFKTGFNILTGETGAGKSILIGSVNMLLGERIGKGVIRNGENSAFVEGLFYVSQPVANYLKSMDFDVEDDGSFIVSRRIFADGKNICKACGKTIPVSKLREIGQVLINVHGQHDNQALLDHTTHIDFLDAFVSGKDKAVFIDYETAYASLLSFETQLAELDMDETERLRRIDILNYEITEIQNANIVVGEEDELKELRSVAKNRAQLQENCARALDVLYENTDGFCAYNFLSEALNAIEDTASFHNGLSETAEKLSEFVYGLEDVISSVRETLNQAENASRPLDEIEERLDTIFRLKRKFGDSEAEILAYLSRAEEELEVLNTSETQKADIEKNIALSKERAIKLAEQMHFIRKKASKKIEAGILSELCELNMEGANFSVQFESVELGKHGFDKVEFLLAANRGEPLKALSKIVSGGELSRIMLAMKNVLSDGDMADALIFDEIDTGISGRAAGKVGEKLREISKKKQVLCVTHLPQIASLSEHHFKIQKSEENERTKTTVKELGNDEKITEIALMIGGDHVTDTTIAQAKEMVK